MGASPKIHTGESLKPDAIRLYYQFENNKMGVCEVPWADFSCKASCGFDDLMYGLQEVAIQQKLLTNLNKKIKEILPKIILKEGS